MSSALIDQTRRVFAADGAMASRLPGYEERPQQLDMATLVARAFGDGRRVVVEAATGTGNGG